MSALWDNVTSAISAIKDFITGFFDISGMILGFIPKPYSTILSVAVIIIVALVALKIVRG